LSETPTPGSALAGLRGGIRRSHLRISAAIDNLFDVDYAAHLWYQRDPYRAGIIVHEPGRTLAIRTTAIW
jgi:outer membrane receptor protein involved in Fe transport